MLALSASRRDGQGFYRMDVSSSHHSREDPLGRLLGQKNVKREGDMTLLEK